MREGVKTTSRRWWSYRRKVEALDNWPGRLQVLPEFAKGRLKSGAWFVDLGLVVLTAQWSTDMHIRFRDRAGCERGTYRSWKEEGFKSDGG